MIYASEELTERVYEAIVKHVNEHQYPPSRRELAAELGVGTASIQAAVQNLKAKGRIRVHPSLARGIMLMEAG